MKTIRFSTRITIGLTPLKLRHKLDGLMKEIIASGSSTVRITNPDSDTLLFEMSGAPSKSIVVEDATTTPLDTLQAVVVREILRYLPDQKLIAGIKL